MINLNFWIDMATIVGIYGILVLGLNLHWGYTGLLNFGHVAFFMIGAYASALVTVAPAEASVAVVFALDQPLIVGALVAILLAAAAGFLIAIPAIRLGEIALALLTLAFADLVHSLITGEEWLAGGTYGLSNLPQPFGDLVGTGLVMPLPGGLPALYVKLWSVAYLLLVVALLVGTYTIIERLGRSPFGRVLKGIREDEEVVEVFGKRTAKFKIYSFAIGAGIAGLAGALWAHYTGAITPTAFLPTVTFTAWVAMILGGSGNNRGVIIGALVLFGSRTVTYFVPQVPGHPNLIASLRLVFIGVILIALMHWKPEGLFSERPPVHLES
jgi:branched-chain amino acid transport system permease protein